MIGDAGAMRDVSVVVESTVLREGLLAVGLGLLGVLLGASMLFAFLREWFVDTSSRAWRLLACLAHSLACFRPLMAPQHDCMFRPSRSSTFALLLWCTYAAPNLSLLLVV